MASDADLHCYLRYQVMASEVKKPRYRVAHVVWKDAHCSTGAEEEGDNEPYLTHSVGFVVKRGKEGLTIAQDCYVRDNGYRVWSFVPRGMIVSVTYLPIEHDSPKKKEPE